MISNRINDFDYDVFKKKTILSYSHLKPFDSLRYFMAQVYIYSPVTLNT
jgi:hypothetical protein